MSEQNKNDQGENQQSQNQNQGDNSNQNSNLTQEDYEQINNDIESAKSSLSSQTNEEIEKAKNQAKEEAKQELEMQKKLEEQEKQNEELKKKLEETEKKSKEQLDALKKKVDDAIDTKMPPNQDQNQDPFQGGNVAKQADKMSDEQIENLEEESARAFFGQDYDYMLNDSK